MYTKVRPKEEKSKNMFGGVKMYKVLEENVMLRIDGSWVNTKVVLSSCNGGKRIDYVDETNHIIKSKPLSRSKYKDMELN